MFQFFLSVETSEVVALSVLLATKGWIQGRYNVALLFIDTVETRTWYVKEGKGERLLSERGEGQEGDLLEHKKHKMKNMIHKKA